MEEFEGDGRLLGGTEYSWWRAVPGGTGITVVALLLSQLPRDTSTLLQNALYKLIISQPILNSSISSTSLSIYSPTPTLHFHAYDLTTTSNLLLSLSSSDHLHHLSHFHLLLHHQLNLNSWSHHSSQVPQAHTPGGVEGGGSNVFFATLYALPDSPRHVLTLRFHTAVCDRTSAVAILKELMVIMREGEGATELEFGGEGKNGKLVGSAIEDMVPKGKGDKPFWVRGLDFIGYSLNSFRASNLDFQDVQSSRSSEVVRLQMSRDETQRLLSECQQREIKLCGALAAAGLIAAHSSKNLTYNQSGNYSIVTLIDCRKHLEPNLDDHHLGFYFSAIINTHSVTIGEKLWGVAERCYAALSNAMKNNKHFTDMGDLNFLMCKAIDNPGLTPSSSQRTAFMSLFEETVIDDSCNLAREVGLEDYIGCSSIHGIGPSIAIFDTVRDGKLDCACVYPSPLHSRKQIQELIDNMKKVLVGESD